MEINDAVCQLFWIACVLGDVLKIENASFFSDINLLLHVFLKHQICKNRICSDDTNDNM